MGYKQSRAKARASSNRGGGPSRSSSKSSGKKKSKGKAVVKGLSVSTDGGKTFSNKSASSSNNYGGYGSASSQSAALQKAITESKKANPQAWSKATFKTSSGPVSISKKGTPISPSSAEGKTIQAIYDRQVETKKVNAAQTELFNKIKNAKNAKEANKIREKAIAKNPNVGTFQQVFKKGELVETKGVLGFKKLESQGPKEIQGPKQIQGPLGPNTFNFFSLPAPSKKLKKSNTDYLKENEKAFFFMPDVPKGEDTFSRIGAGVVKGSSNAIAGFYNLPIMASDFLGDPVKDSDYAKFYSTPVTNVETGFFDVASTAVKSKVEGKPYTVAQAKSRIQTGFDEAYDNFFKDPAASSGSLIELVPYFGYGAAKTGSKLIGNTFDNFFGSGKTTASKTVRPPPKNLFIWDNAEPGFLKSNTKLGSGAGNVFDSSKRTGNFVDDFMKGAGTKKTKGGGTYKEYKATDFFKPKETPTKSGQVLLQKTKTKTKPKSMYDEFFKQKQKTKVKQKTKQKTKQKQKSMFDGFMVIPKQTTKQTTKQDFMQIPKFASKQKTKASSKSLLSPKLATKSASSTKTPRLIGGFILFHWLGGRAAGAKTKRNKRGSKDFTAWNVDDSRVGGFFKGPSYRTSRSSRVFKDADDKVKKSSKKKKKDWVSTFFD